MSIHTVRLHYKNGLLPASKLGRRVRVTPDQFDDYVTRLEAAGRGPVETGAPTRAETVELLRTIIESGALDDQILAAYRRVREKNGAGRGGDHVRNDK